MRELLQSGGVGKGSKLRQTMQISERAQVRRIPKRAVYDRETIHAILDAGFLAHIGFCVEGQPFVIPTLYGRSGDKLYLHGSAASRMLRTLEKGAQICVDVTLVDGLVLARSAFHHSMNYRSAVLFGTARKLDDPQQKIEGLRIISEHLIAGRWDEVRAPNEKELKATSVLEFVIEDASAKVRSGHPVDEEEDYGLQVWAGVVPLELKPGRPLADPRLAGEIALAESVVRYRK
ncbi:MAG: pyridoxamine 5'-phosphate oxidase family protein [Bacillota bacterium]|nr:pyridoxamine 5'-phosphate oxidase family protein [Bacillota bacterium]